MYSTTRAVRTFLPVFKQHLQPGWKYQYALANRPYTCNIRAYATEKPSKFWTPAKIPSDLQVQDTINELLSKMPVANTEVIDPVDKESFISLVRTLEKSTKTPTSSLNKPTFLDYLTLPNFKTKLFYYVTHVNDVSDEQWSVIFKENGFVSQVQEGSDPGVAKKEKIMYVLTKTYGLIQSKLQSKKAIQNNDSTIDDAIINNPVAWYPEARMMKRKIIMHVGPTNSGKTYHALQRLKNCERNGYYAGPLRLLAREIYERFKSDNIRCNLLTGEEIIQDLDEIGNPANLTSGTVEMVPLNRDFECVVLDEIQMMADPQRGWAWSNIVLGCRAKELHLCGEQTVVPIIKKLVEETGDSLQIIEYERLGKLEIEDAHTHVKSFQDKLKKGDCLIAFSKKKIMKLKLQIEKSSKHKVAVIYGSLPPETRLQQAKLFNEGHYDVLVASDAVGMGLNLSIKRILFTSAEKFDGEKMVPLTVSNIKQIGGRAGRYQSDSKKPSIGYVGATDKSILSSVNEGLKSPIVHLNTMIVWPPDNIIYEMIKNIPRIDNADLTTLLTSLSTSLEESTRNLFQLADLNNRIETLQIIQPIIGLTFQDRLVLSNAPCKFQRPMLKTAFYHFCKTIAQERTMTITNFSLPFELIDLKYLNNEDAGSLDVYEDLHQVFQLYSWLGNRWPNYLVGIETARVLRDMCELIIFYKLETLKKNPYDKGDGFGSSSSRKEKFGKKNSKDEKFPREIRTRNYAN